MTNTGNLAIFRQVAIIESPGPDEHNQVGVSEGVDRMNAAIGSTTFYPILWETVAANCQRVS